MDPRVSFVTLAARDLAATRAFYVDGLGWTPELDVPGEVVMIKVGEHLVLSLWDEAQFEAEVGPIVRGEGVPAFALAHNVATREEVDAVLAEATALGVEVDGPEEREWGGYTGYFTAPDGVRWEIAWNPGPIGQTVLPLTRSPGFETLAERLLPAAPPHGGFETLAERLHQRLRPQERCGTLAERAAPPSAAGVASLAIHDSAVGRPVRDRRQRLPRGGDRVRGRAARARARRTGRGRRVRRGRAAPRAGADSCWCRGPTGSATGLHFDGHDLQVGLTEPARHNAIHGLARWTAWTAEEHTATSVSLGYRLMAQTGYPWTLDLHVVYDLSADGLTVTQTATNLSARPAPYASGAHPYLTAGAGPVDRWELTLPASLRLVADDRKIPVGEEAVDGTAYDFRMARPVRDLVLDDGFGDLARSDERHGDRRGARPGDRPGCRAVGRPPPPVADGLHRRRPARPGGAPVAGGGADDGAARRVPHRPRPAHPGPGRGARRRGRQSPGGSGRCTDSSPARRSSRNRSSRTAIRARSPSADWMPSAWMLVPSARSRVANGAPRGSWTATTSAHS